MNNTVEDKREEEYPNVHHIVFNGPSRVSIALLNYALEYRYGATPWDYPQEELQSLLSGTKREEYILAQTTLPEDHPLSEIDVTFAPYEYENSPFSGRNEYKHITGYSLDLVAKLKKPHRFEEKDARHILEILNQNTGHGEYSQLDNGKHRIIIPGYALLNPIFGLKYREPLLMHVALLDLGYDDPDRGIQYLKELREENRNLLDDDERKYFKERIQELQEFKKNPMLDSVKIELRSGEEFREGIDKGGYNSIEGHRRDLGLKDETVDFFFNQTAPYLLEALCDHLSPNTTKTLAMIRVAHPDAYIFGDTDPGDITGKPPTDWKKTLYLEP